jgi:MFS family permease
MSDYDRGRPGLLASFDEPEFQKVWGSAVLFGLGLWAERVAMGWFVLDATGSVLLTTLSFAIRTMPNIVVGPIAGAASDRFSRATILAVAAMVRAVAVAAMAVVVLWGGGSIPLLLGLVLVTGSTNAFQTTSLNALQADIVGRERLGNAISLTQMGQRTVGVIGGLSGGFLLGWLGPGPAFLAATGPLILAAVGYSRVSVTREEREGTERSGFISEVIEGLALIVRIPVVRLLLTLMILVEILGFSWNSLLPAVAELVLEVGPEGLGALMASTALGSMVGTLILVATSHWQYRGRMLLVVFAVFGLLLIALGLSRSFVVSLVIVAGLGATSSMVDALEWIMLQSNVPDRLRGRALGGWIFAIGFGWLGPISLGALAEVTSVGRAVATGGSLLLMVALISALVAPRLSRGEGRI